MKVRHPTLKNCSSISSHGSFNLDANGEAEVSAELGAHLLKCGFLAVAAPAAEPAVVEPPPSIPPVMPDEEVAPVEQPEPPAVTPPATPKAKTKRK